MKKRLIKIIVFIILIMPCYVYAEDISYENAQKIVKEVMQAWYMRGSYLQYNSSKNVYYEFDHPEDLTSQDMGYTVCSGYTSDVYKESFGVDVGYTTDERNKYNIAKIPELSTEYCYHTNDYITKNTCTTGNLKNKCNGEYAIYSEATGDDSSLYFYTGENPTTNYSTERPTVEEFAKQVKPGDIFAFTGHVMMAYDVVTNPTTGKLDVLLLQSGGGGGVWKLIKTKIDDEYSNGTRRLYYGNKVANNPKRTNDFINLNVAGSLMINEGTVQNSKWLSDLTTSFVKNGKIQCSRTYCSVSRFFYKDGNNAKFNYTVKEQQIKNSMVRTKLPGIFIHKTADSLDNNSVYPDQTITYTIKIANQSNVNVKDGGKNYSKFYVSEVIPTDKVEFVSATNNGVYSNGKITWTINSLNSASNIDLKYTVKVKNNDEVIGKKIDAEGTVYIDNTGSITTGVVSNEVIRKPATKKDSYKNCYNKYKDSKKELELIDEVYKCAYGVDLKLTKFSVDGDDNNMFSKLIEQLKNSSGGRTGYIKLINNDDTKNYYNMVLNDYWNNNMLLKKGDIHYYMLPPWKDTYRADTIYGDQFRDGDILIYYNDDTYTKENLKFTKEQGIYAYIYLDGKFVGQNQTGDAVRNEFTYDYYPESTRATNLIEGTYSNEELTFANYQTLFGKDYYVILRPEKIIQSNGIDIVVPDTKMNNSQITTIISLIIISLGLIIFVTSKKKIKKYSK